MTSKGRKYFSGDTLEQALMQAARHHGLQPEEVAYRKIEKRHGFLKARKGIVIEVDPEAPQSSPEEPVAPTQEAVISEPIREEALPPEVESKETEEHAVTAAESAPAPEPMPDTELQPEEEPAAEEAIHELAEAARRGLQEILEFARLDLEYDVQQGEDQLEIELRGPDEDRLVEDRGNLLLAIQHLLPRLIRGHAGRSIACRVDSNNFHQRRAEELEALATEAAQEVRRRQQPRTLPPMNPAERRIIHVTLADDAEVVTESQGKGFFKRVTVSPAIRRPRGFDRYSSR